jgi:membrane protease YdiL (CAAX protease family)
MAENQHSLSAGRAMLFALLAGIAISHYGFIENMVALSVPYWQDLSPVSERLAQQYDFLDTAACMIMILIYGIWLWRLRPAEAVCAEKPEKDVPGEGAPAEGMENTAPGPTGHLTPGLMWRLVVVTFGMGGIADIWMMAAENVLYGMPAIAESLERFEDAWSGEAEEAYIWVLLSVAVVGPIVEELIFRGVAYAYLERIRGGWFPIVMTALLFGIWHGELVQTVYTAMMGVALGIVFRRTRMLRAVIFIHILNNLLSTLPEAWNTDFVLDSIQVISGFMIIPALIILAQMVRWKDPGQTDKTEKAAARSES